MVIFHIFVENKNNLECEIILEIIYSKITVVFELKYFFFVKDAALDRSSLCKSGNLEEILTVGVIWLEDNFLKNHDRHTLPLNKKILITILV